MKALGRLRNEKAVKPLIEIVLNKRMKKTIRKEAMEALGMIKDNRAVETLIQALKDPDKNFQKDAIVALGKIGDKRAIEPLIQHLKYARADIKCEIMEVLGNLGDKKIEGTIKRILKDEDPNVCKKAEEALKKIEARDKGHYSRFAEDLCCKHCSGIHGTELWPVYGDRYAFQFKTEPGEYTLEVKCPHCQGCWYVVWDSDPGPIKPLAME